MYLFKILTQPVISKNIIFILRSWFSYVYFKFYSNGFLNYILKILSKNKLSVLNVLSVKLFLDMEIIDHNYES